MTYDTSEADAMLCGISAAGTFFAISSWVARGSLFVCEAIYYLRFSFLIIGVSIKKTELSLVIKLSWCPFTWDAKQLALHLIDSVRLAIVWLSSAIWRFFPSSCFISQLTSSFIFNSDDEAVSFMIWHLRKWYIYCTINMSAKPVNMRIYHIFRTSWEVSVLLLWAGLSKAPPLTIWTPVW